MFTVVPTQEHIFTVLRSALQAILPAGIEIVQAQDNRVIEPQQSDFVVMTPLRRDRLETNVDTPFDCLFTASIAGTTMTVTSVTYGVITLGNQLFGTGVTANTKIISQLSGSAGDTAGGLGTYKVSILQSDLSQPMASGVNSLLQPTNFMIQLDVHGPNSGDNVQVISTIFRDEYGVNLFASACAALGLPLAAVTPLYADDPTQQPFINAEDQFEFRWIVQAYLQANESLTVPQQFAGIVTPTFVEVVTAFPA